MTYLLFAVWFVLLIKWADLLTDWASSIAKKFWLSSLVIWLTIVAFGTSLPEFVVSSLASFSWNNEIAFANILGSNVANIFLVLWIAWLIRTLKVESSTVYKEIPFALLTMLMLWAFVFDKFLNGQSENILTRWEGISLLLVFVIFLYYTFWISKNHSEEDWVVQEFSVLKSIIFILLWFTWLVLWWKWIVEWAVLIAQNFWLSEALIWSSIIAIWTSLPEVAASWMAAYKWKTSMAVWAVVGSNIFNVAWVLWANAVILPVAYSETLNLDIFFSVWATILLFIFMFIWKKHQLCKWQAALFLLIYLVYLFFVTLRG